MSAVIGRSDKVAIVSMHFDAYTDGLAFVVEVRTHPDASHIRGVREECINFVRQGVSLVDDTSAAREGLGAGLLATSPHSTLAATQGWGGGVAEGFGLWHGGYFLSPYPESLTMVAWWPEVGIATSSVTIDDAELRSARNRVVDIF